MISLASTPVSSMSWPFHSTTVPATSVRSIGSSRDATPTSSVSSELRAARRASDGVDGGRNAGC
eukprot:3907699-Prymnesium_polylepis.1